MRRIALTLLLAGLPSLLVIADDSAESVQQKFNARYREFLRQDSQALLPLPLLDKAEWNSIQQTRPLQKLYSEANRFYNSKSYTFTLYLDSESGSYYLDAKGGFWGMEQLSYGPMSGAEWQ